MATIHGGDLPQEQKRSMIMELQKGRKTAIHLQTLLKNPRKDDDNNGISGLQELSLQIFNSFTNILSELTALPDESNQAVDCCRRRKKKLPAAAVAGVKNRRGCYKRRRPSESWIVESPSWEDEFAWRKYGQKMIMDSQFPRCYYRCTHKYDGCKAIKQVQRVQEKPLLYQITYLSHHTCINTSKTISYPNFNLQHPSQSKNIINFQNQKTYDEDDESSKSIHPVKLENYVDDQNDEVPSDTRSSTLVTHDDNLIGAEIGTESADPWLDEMCSGLQSRESTSLQYGMEVMSLISDNIDSFFYFEYNDRMY